jgi:hypothetical protein
MGQVAFEQANAERGLDKTFSNIPSFGGGISFYDFNQDGWDDITMTTDSFGPLIFYENRYGTYEQVSIGINQYSDDRSVFWIDYDNDDDMDLLVIQRNEGFRLYKNNGFPNLSNVTNSAGFGNLSSDMREGCGIGDYNNDGLLDLYDCSYQLENDMYFQNSNHTFTNVSNISNTSDSTRFSFQTITFDYDEDGDMDFYVSNDYADGNQFFRNNGDSSFSDVSEAVGANEFLCSMGLALGDPDGDLDLDIYNTDRFVQSRFLKNNGALGFAEIGQQAGIDYPGGFGWGCLFFDADYDGDEDLYVSGIMLPFTGGEPSLMFINNGNGTFDADTLPNDSLYSFASALGDFDNDRKPDMIVLNSNGNDLSLWHNVHPNPLDALTVELKGCTCNRQAIGATLKTYAGSSTHLYSFHAVESFLGQSSERKQLPLYEGVAFDSIEVRWPFGNVTKLFDVLPNQRLVISECDSARPDPVILVPGYAQHKLNLCTGDSIQLVIDGLYTDILWSTGDTTQEIWVTEGGDYSATVTNQFNASSSAAGVTIEGINAPNISGTVLTNVCNNGNSINIQTNDTANSFLYAWSNGHLGPNLDGVTPGWYILTVSNNGLCQSIDSFYIPPQDSVAPLRANVSLVEPLCFGQANGSLHAQGIGGYGQYQYHWSTGQITAYINAAAGNYTVTITDSLGCTFDTSAALGQPALLQLEVLTTPDTNFQGLGSATAYVSGGTPTYTVQWSDSLLQTGYQATHLKAGAYQATAYDSNGCDTVLAFDIQNVDLTGKQSAQPVRSLRCRRNETGIYIVSEGSRLGAISIYSMDGRRVSYQIVGRTEHSLSVSVPHSGVYTVMDHLGNACTCAVVP